jgi:transposase-like protein
MFEYALWDARARTFEKGRCGPDDALVMRTMARPQKITFGEMRAMGIRDVLVYCADYKCSHSIEMNADRRPDHVRLSDVADRFVCTACGKRWADERTAEAVRRTLPELLKLNRCESRAVARRDRAIREITKKTRQIIIQS